MKRRIIEIDENKCNGCGACAEACHEGAIAMVDGKARLMRDDYCDGLGDCLPACPTGAITFVEREAAAYDEQAVMENKQRKMRKEGMTLPCGCPGSQSRNIQREIAPAVEAPRAEQASRLSQWPVQIKLVPVNAPYFDGARLLIAADCTAYAYAAFHERFIKGHITLVGCPKLDSVDYAEKLTEIIRENDIKSVTVVRMEVPCCGGLELAAKKALQPSFGFLLGLIPAAAVIGALTARHHSHPAVFLAALVGDLVLYLVGVPYMYLIMRLYLGSDATLAALVLKMAVFIPGDLIKLAIVTLAAPPLLRCLEKAGYTRS